MKTEVASSRTLFVISDQIASPMKTQTKNLTRLLDNKLVQAQRANARRLSDIEHRLEYVDSIDGVEYINDAKASDANSSWYSIDSMEAPVIWIISSCSYEEDLSLFYEMDASKVKAVRSARQSKAIPPITRMARLERGGPDETWRGKT